jgi:hypothetical protein
MRELREDGSCSGLQLLALEKLLGPSGPFLQYTQTWSLLSWIYRGRWVGLDIKPTRLGSAWLVRITSWFGSVHYPNELKVKLGSARQLELALSSRARAAMMPVAGPMEKSARLTSRMNSGHTMG